MIDNYSKLDEEEKALTTKKFVKFFCNKINSSSGLKRGSSSRRDLKAWYKAKDFDKEITYIILGDMLIKLSVLSDRSTNT